MKTRVPVSVVCVLAALCALPAGPALGAAPIRESDAYTVTISPDPFWSEMCGITADTTVTERWRYLEFSDGRVIFHDVRRISSGDARLPLERGAGTASFAPDGTMTVVGMPLQLFSPDGGLLLRDAGRVVFADGSQETVLSVAGPHPGLTLDLASYYCP